MLFETLSGSVMDFRVRILWELWDKENLSLRDISRKVATDKDLQESLGVSKLSHERIRQYLEMHPDFKPTSLKQAHAKKRKIVTTRGDADNAKIWSELVNKGIEISDIARITEKTPEEIIQILNIYDATNRQPLMSATNLKKARSLLQYGVPLERIAEVLKVSVEDLTTALE